MRIALKRGKDEDPAENEDGEEPPKNAGGGSKVTPEGSQLILATDVVRTPSAANQLEPALEGVTEAEGPVQRMFADGGYVTAEVIERVQQRRGLPEKSLIRD